MTATMANLAVQGPEPTSEIMALITGLDTALVLGDEAAVAAVGTPIATLPPKVALGLALGNAALHTLGAATSSGRLVRLTEASHNSLKESGKDLTPGKVFSGVNRNPNGQITEHLQFTALPPLEVASEVGQALAAVALQLQLQQITEQLTDVRRTVGEIHTHLTDELVSAVETHAAELARAHEALQESGEVPDVDWPAISRHTEEARQCVRQLKKKLYRAIEALHSIGGERSAADRLKALDRVEREERPLLWFALYLKAQRAVMTGEYLRLHRFISTASPHLEVRRRDGVRHLSAQITKMIVVCEAFETAILRAAIDDELADQARAISLAGRFPDLERRFRKVRMRLPSPPGADLAGRVGELRAHTPWADRRSELEDRLAALYKRTIPAIGQVRLLAETAGIEIPAAAIYPVPES